MFCQDLTQSLYSSIIKLQILPAIMSSRLMHSCKYSISSSFKGNGFL